MKYLRLFGILLVFIFIVTFLLSMVLPTRQIVERTITINASAASVYHELVSLKKFNSWSVWNRNDSTIVTIISGTDGQVGATSNWSGDPGISGEGKIVIREIDPNKKVVHDLSFIKPKKRSAVSVLSLNETHGVTSVTWEFTMATPRPWNIFNLFSSMDREMGKDFEEGLALLKASVEGGDAQVAAQTASSYETRQINFPAITYAMIRQNIQWKDIAAFYAQHSPIVHEESDKAGLRPANPTGLIYEWDEKNQRADYAAAVRVQEGSTIDNNIIRIEKFPASKAIAAEHHGSYDKLGEAHTAIKNYLDANKLTSKLPVIEQYVTGPAIEKDTAKWLTKIVYLIK